jgi:hypothetical protein
VAAGGEKLREMTFRLPERIGMHDAGNVEAVRTGDVANGGLEAVGVV